MWKTTKKAAKEKPLKSQCSIAAHVIRPGRSADGFRFVQRIGASTRRLGELL